MLGIPAERRTMRISTNGNTATISKMPRDAEFYVERNSAVAGSPVTQSMSKDPTEGKLLRRRLLSSELEGRDYTPVEMPSAIAQAWAMYQVGKKQTLDRKRIGERSYVLYEALANDQKVTFRGCYPGHIMIWNATPMKNGETYESNQSALVDFVEIDDETGCDKKVHFTNVEDSGSMERAHGTLYTVKGSFLAAELAVKAEVYHTKDVAVKRFSETDDSFQKFSGKGNVLLNVHGYLIEIPLYPKEAVDIWPGYLLGFTEGITLSMHSAGDVTLRNEENNDYVIRLKAGDEGGFVYAHSALASETHQKKDD